MEVFDLRSRALLLVERLTHSMHDFADHLHVVEVFKAVYHVLERYCELKMHVFSDFLVFDNQVYHSKRLQSLYNLGKDTGADFGVPLEHLLHDRICAVVHSFK
jgi:hypothetical protein